MLKLFGLGGHHAQSVARGAFQYPPITYTSEAFRAQRFQPGDFRLDVISLDIEMYAAGVIDLLHLNMRVIPTGLQKYVVLIRRIVRPNRVESKRTTPELGRPF